MLQSATPWKHLKTDIDADGRNDSLASLAFGWRICRYLAIVTQPFLPFSAQRLWDMLGISTNIEDVHWDEAIDWNVSVEHPSSSYEPLFKRLDVNEIVEEEQSYIESQEESHDLTHNVKGGKKEKKSMKNEAPEGIEYLDFDTFMEVELRVGRIASVEDHPMQIVCML